MVLVVFYTENPLSVATQDPLSAPTSVKVVPNPAQDRTTVQITGKNAISQFRLFDAAGRLVQTRHTMMGAQIEVDLSDLSPGLYWFNADGYTGKIIKS